MNKTKKGHLGKALLMGTAIVSLSALESEVHAQVSGSGLASAVVLDPITVTNGQVLHFGSFTVPATGNIVIGTDGTVTPTGVRRITGGANPAVNGLVDVSGSKNTDMSFTFAATTAVLTNGTGDTMVVGSFLMEDKSGVDIAAPGPGTIEITATATTITAVQVPVGATLTVADPAQGAGTYTGTYTVSVDY